jgi:cobalamin biosynthesis protein CobT
MIMADIFYLPPDDPDLDRPYITAREFQEATKTAVRTISTDFDTAVSFAGDMACTDGHRVILPQINPEHMMTHREVNVGRGYANHESLHKLLTDFEVGQTWMSKMMKTGRPFTVHMGQAIEDVRIENGGQSLYAGISKSIDKTAEQVCKEFKKIADKDPDICKDAWKVLPVAVTWIGRMKLGYPSKTIEQAFNNLSDDIKKRATLIASATLGLPHGVEGVGQINQAVAHKGSRLGMDLAEMVCNELAKDIPPPPPEEISTPMMGASGSKTKGKSKTGVEGKSAVGGAGKQDEGKSSKMSVADQSEKRGHGSTMSPTKEDILTRQEPTPFDPELNQVLEHFSPESSKGKVNKNKGAFTYDNDLIEEPTEAQENPDFYRSEYKRARDSLGSKLGTMRRKLEKALITKTESDYVTSRVGKLNIRRKSAELFMGGQMIRKKKSDGESIDTAVTLLVDCSGSMSGQPMVLAGHSAIALSECLSSGGVPYEVLGHTTMRLDTKNGILFRSQQRKLGERDKDGHKETLQENRWEREEAIYMPVFKPYDKTLNQCKHLMGFIPNASHSCNADADALLYAGERLMKRPETNKILMLIADGYPAWRGEGNLTEITRRAVVKLNRDGIKTIGIGINCDSVKQFFERWVVVNHVDDLSKHVLDQVAKMILGQRFHIDNSDLIKGESNGTK